MFLLSFVVVFWECLRNCKDGYGNVITAPIGTLLGSANVLALMMAATESFVP